MINKKLLIVLTCLFANFHLSAKDYFPEPGEWQSHDAEKLGIDASQLKAAVKFAQDNEYSGSRDLKIAILKGFEREPFHQLLGPVKERGGPAGLIVKNGYIAAQWGDLERVDMTFSVTKSYLSTVAGVAFDRNLIVEPSQKVNKLVWNGTFDGAHNSQITWHTLLNQSSDWSGELFGIKDWADRPPREGGLDDWKFRKLHPPGSHYEYNDVRVNLLAYSLLQVWRKPLPQVLKQTIMDPIGAGPSWRWFGYDDAWVTIDGLQMKSVTGGGHSGGGVWINTLDQARFGYLFLRDGNWNGNQLISKDWIKRATTPSEAYQSYGYMWWLNQGPRKLKGVNDESIYYAAGFGGNYIVIDRKNDLMIVTRWLEPSKLAELTTLVHKSLR